MVTKSRQEIKDIISLREAKDYVDAIHDDMKKRGMSR